jgi:hypothetical protein
LDNPSREASEVLNIVSPLSPERTLFFKYLGGELPH